MAGRKAIPKEMKILKGTFQSCRDKTPIHGPDKSEMQPPIWLRPEAVSHFNTLRDRIAVIGLNSATFSEMLGLAALRMSDIEELDAIILADGRFIYDKDGNIFRSHPAVDQRSTAYKHLQSILAEFGLSPSAIQRVGAKTRKDDNPFAALG